MIFDKGRSIKIHADRCLNRIYCRAECRHCLAHCPADAIILDAEQIDLKGDLCTGCGLCLSDCPTQVFRSDQWDETSVIEQVKSRRWTKTAFFCARHSTPCREDQIPDRGALQLPACLSLVSRGAWFELGLQTAVELHLEQCEGCPMAKTLSRLEVAVGTASEWLAASGHTPQFSFMRTGRTGLPGKDLQAVATGFRVTSRRDLFLSLIQRGKQFAGPIFESQQQQTTENNRRNIHPLVPDWLIRMAEIYPKYCGESSSLACWPTIQINPSCVHCGMCTLLCPSGALRRTADDGMCSYTFTGGLCLDCRICKLVCQQEAIVRNKQPIARPFDSTTVYRATVLECKRCGSVASDFSTGLCHACSSEKAIDRAFQEACHALLGDANR